MKGQLAHSADRRQASLEDAMASLGTTLALLEQIRLRVQQANRRANLADLLGPVIDHLDRIIGQVKTVQTFLRAQWEIGQAIRWQDLEQRAYSDPK